MPDAAGRIRRMLGLGIEVMDGAARRHALRHVVLEMSSRFFPRLEKTVEELRAMTTGNESAPYGSSVSGSASAA